MIVNEVDKFRQDFFDKIIKERKERERKTKLLQSNCFHKYDLIGDANEQGYQEITCSKCGHSTLKRAMNTASKQVDGTKNGCIIC